METCRYGIMGAGRIAGKFAGTFQQGLVKKAELTAVASTDPARAAGFAKTYGIRKSYGSYAELLLDPDIDIVYVATTNNAHYRCCLDAIAAGKHVLCEKPLVLTGREAEELAEAAKVKGVFLMEAMWSRFLPATQQAAQWVRDGRIGSLRSVSASFCVSRDPEEYRRLYDPALGGGAFFDLGVYVFMLVQYMAGDRKLLKASPVCVPAKTGVDGSTFLHLLYDDGMVGEIKCSVTFNARNEAYLCGERGYIRIAPFFSCAQKVELFAGPPAKGNEYELPEPTEVFLKEISSGFEYEIDHAAACVKAGRLESDVVPLADSIETAGIYDLIVSELAKQSETEAKL